MNQSGYQRNRFFNNIFFSLFRSPKALSFQQLTRRATREASNPKQDDPVFSINGMVYPEKEDGRRIPRNPGTEKQKKPEQRCKVAGIHEKNRNTVKIRVQKGVMHLSSSV